MNLSRRLIVAIAVTAHVTTLMLAANPQAFAAPCPVHANIAQVADHAGSHEEHTRHQAGHAMPAEADGEPGHPMMPGFACCAHLVGMLTFSVPEVSCERAGPHDHAFEQSVMPGLLSGLDPPPRLL